MIRITEIDIADIKSTCEAFKDFSDALNAASRINIVKYCLDEDGNQKPDYKDLNKFDEGRTKALLNFIDLINTQQDLIKSSLNRIEIATNNES